MHAAALGTCVDHHAGHTRRAVPSISSTRASPFSPAVIMGGGTRSSYALITRTRKTVQQPFRPCDRPWGRPGKYITERANYITDKDSSAAG
jgi:hypothetical protein